jgi:hypothetical protein
MRGTSDDITIGNGLGYYITSAITIVAAVYTTDNTNGSPVAQAIIGKRKDEGATSRTNFKFSVATSAGVAGRLQFSFSPVDSNTINLYRASNDDYLIANNTWQIVAVTFTYGDSDSIKLYRGTDLVPGAWADGAGSATPGGSSAYLHIGSVDWPGDDSGHNQAFSGRMGDVLIWDKALTSDKITQVYNALISQYQYTDEAITTDLQAWWKHDEGSGSTLTDYA